MTGASYDATDRRPIAARKLAIMHRIAAGLVRARVSANSISMAGMICGMAAGACLWGTAHSGDFPARALWICAAALVQLRLLANLLDGMVAIASATASKVGELFNEIPDRISDAVGLVGLGYASGGMPVLGWLAAVFAIFTAYVRTVGKAGGVPSDYRGPMAKQQRMFLVTMTCGYCAIAPHSWQQWNAGQWCLAVISAGCAITVIRRLGGIASSLRSKA